MLHPDTALIETRQQQYLQEAEATRLYRQIKGHRPSLLQRINDVLSGIGPQVKIQAPANMVMSGSITR